MGSSSGTEWSEEEKYWQEEKEKAVESMVGLAVSNSCGEEKGKIKQSKASGELRRESVEHKQRSGSRREVSFCEYDVVEDRRTAWSYDSTTEYPQEVKKESVTSPDIPSSRFSAEEYSLFTDNMKRVTMFDMGRATCSTSSETREEPEIAGRRLAAQKAIRKSSFTGSSTRDELELAKKEIASLKRRPASGFSRRGEPGITESSSTGSMTREELDRVKVAIAKEKMAFKSDSSSRTKEELERAKKELALLKQRSASGSSTREELAHVRAAIAREMNESMYSTDSRSSSRESLEESQAKLTMIRARKEEIRQLFKQLKLSESADLCFLVDCTGSMSSYISEVKLRIGEIVELCKLRFNNLQFRVAFVGYRDHGDRGDRITSFDFSPCIDTFRQFLSAVEAKGGQDGPEDVFGGLEEAGKMGWKVPTRILFHISDAPCHGSRFNDMHDDYPRGDPRGLLIENLLRRIEDLKVTYWFAELTQNTRKMIGEFQKVMRGKIKETELKSATNLLNVVVDSISETISEIQEGTIADFCKTLGDDSATKVPNRSLKTYDLVKEVPHWDEMSAEEVIVLKNRLPTSFDQLRQPLHTSTGKRFVKIASDPFDEGAQRVAYYGLDTSFSQNVQIVFKEFKYLGHNYNSKEKYLKQMEIQSVSAYLAQNFNKSKPKESNEVFFTKIQVVSFNKRSKPFYCTRETLIQGEYVKFNNNTGYVNKHEYAATLNAFSHWTHHVTGGYLMVIDLQGVKVDNGTGREKFILTDPSIHCKDVTRFGKTNLGKPGMLRFFNTHICSSVCEALMLPKPIHRRRIVP